MSQAAKKEKPKTNGTLLSIKTLFSLFWKLDKAYFFWLVLQALAGAANGLINLVLPKMLLDGINKGWAWDSFLKGLLLFVLVKYLILQALSFLKRQFSLHGEKLQHLVPNAFSQKIMRLPYQSLEDPDVLDLRERAMFPIYNSWVLENLFASFIDMLTGAFTLTGLAVLLYVFSPLFLLALVILCVVASLLSARFIKYMRDQNQELIPVNRRYGYWAGTATVAQHQKEFRVYDLQAVMRDKIAQFTEDIMLWIHRMKVRSANNETLQSLITALMRVMAYGYTALRVFGAQYGPQIQLSDYAVIVMAAENFFSTYQLAFTGLFETLSSIHHLQPFSQFMQLEEMQKAGGKAPEALRTLSFDKVSFAYPKGDRQVLDKVSFEIKAGEKISIVGLNNAGKSTMVKLICRLFEPQEGRILWNGVDIREYDMKAYLKELSCVFQDFYLFPFTIRDNIDPKSKGSEQSILDTLEEVDLLSVISRLDAGLNTYLNKEVWDKATDLSGGEKQKLAIARSLYRPASLVMLDEPTAALDPLAESEVYEHFHQLTRGRTAIFISHRMSSSTFCDRILLLQDGGIAAFDSHANLMRGHNLYRELFLAQAKHFQSGQDVLKDQG